MLESPALLAEAKAGLPALTTVATFPAGRAGVQRVLAKALVIYRMDMTEPEWALWWDSYVDDLGDLSEAALEAGMKAHRLSQNAEFMPKPGRLRDLARTTPNRPTSMLERVQAALDRVEARESAARRAALQNEPQEPDRPRLTKTQVDEMLADYRAQMQVRRDANRPAPVPPQHGRTDERGVTHELRRIMSERGGE